MKRIVLPLRLYYLSFSALLSLFLMIVPVISAATQTPAAQSPDVRVPILLYHRIGPSVADGMTITTDEFAFQMKYLRDNGFKVIPLRQLIEYLQKRGPAPAPKSVVIVEDDAHKSVYTEMLPVVKKYGFPVTIFIYPSAVSNASYAMTWDQLRDLKKTGLFDMEAHTFWHPNFKKEKKRMKREEYDKFVDVQFRKANARIEKELGTRPDMLAWPFGIYDEELMAKARSAGYIAAFSIERRKAAARDNLMAVPRFMITAADKRKDFEAVLSGTR